MVFPYCIPNDPTQKSMMGKLTIFLILCSITMAFPLVFGVADDPKGVEEWFHKITNHYHHEQKITKLHFYYHDLLGVTRTVVAQSNTTSTSPTYFGATLMMDNPLTVGLPFTGFQVIGRAQGLYGSSSMEEPCNVVAMNLIFTHGPYNGSTLTVLGHNPILHPNREMPVIGGSGVFRLARGVVLLNTYSYNFTVGNLTVEYNVMVQHY
ncbi:Dirigent protein [Actinidia chinensis var. chinensis]|uniref:Dirigent protein n=1 Tax=Actinidia chinensis var. chinensis TaxID=1590841 RepID=A0A2R6R6W0_ACTCC|nr:Dirigent protein [Actinidia chinensis var. chinensis]